MRFALLTPLLLIAPAAYAADEKVAWYADPTTATAMAALVIFLLLVAFVGGFRFVFSKLDERATGIQSQIDEARAMREEASKLMADAKKKAKEADAAAEARIARAEADAAAEVRRVAADAATEAARSILSGSGEAKDLFDNALGEIDKRLN